MELFGVGIGEAGLVLLIALLVVGPERFPQIAREGGRWYRMARRFTADVTADLRTALDELESEVKEQTGELKSVREIGDDVRAGMRETSADLDSIGRGVGTTANADAAASTVTTSGAALAVAAPGGPAAAPALDAASTPPLPNVPPADMPAPARAATNEELQARVLSAYSEFHTPAPALDAAAAAPEVDADEMSRHAAESFEGFRGATAPAPPAAIVGVNPFPSSPPPEPRATEPTSLDEGVEHAVVAETPSPAPAGATSVPPQRTVGAPATPAAES